MKNDSIEIPVIDNNVDRAIKDLKRGMINAGIFTTLKMRNENPNRSDRKKFKKKKAANILLKKHKKQTKRKR